MLEKIPIEYQQLEIYALGGIDRDTILKAKKIQYKGVGVLGAIWRSKLPLQVYLNLKKRLCQK